MVCAFKGWNDAGEAASAAVSLHPRALRRRPRSRAIDPEEFFDFTAVRPTVRLTEGLTREIDWPANAISPRPGAGRRGRPRDVPGRRAVAALAAASATAVIATARELDVRMVITLGALLADVPHTPPVSDHRHRLRRVAGRAARLRAHQLRGPDRHRRRAPPRLRRRPACRRRACGPRCPTTSRRRPTPRWRWRWCAPSRAPPAWRSTPASSRAPPRTTSARSAPRSPSDPEVKAFVERLESAMDEVEADDRAEEDLPRPTRSRATSSASCASAAPNGPEDA